MCMLFNKATKRHVRFCHDVVGNIKLSVLKLKCFAITQLLGGLNIIRSWK